MKIIFRMATSSTGLRQDAGDGAALRNTSTTFTFAENEGGPAASLAQGAENRAATSEAEKSGAVRNHVPPRKRKRILQDVAELTSPERARTDGDDNDIKESLGTGSPPESPTSPGLSASSPPEFTNLVEEALNHPAFPAVLLKLFAAASNRAVSSTLPSDISKSIHEADENLLKLADFANSCGVEAAVRSTNSPLDIFFAIISAAIASINTNANNYGNNSDGDNILAQVLSACERSCSVPTLWGGLSVPRAKLDAASRRILDDWFDAHFDKPYPDEDTKAALAEECGLTLSQIATYFANRRMRKKRKMLKTSPNMDDGVIGTNAPALSKWRVAVMAGGTGNLQQLNINIDPTRPTTTTAPMVLQPQHNMQQLSVPLSPSPSCLEALTQSEYSHGHQEQHYFEMFPLPSEDPLAGGLVNPPQPPLRNISDGYSFVSGCSTPPRPHY